MVTRVNETSYKFDSRCDRSRSIKLALLKTDNLIRPCEAGGWDITSLGAILFAHKTLSAMDKSNRVRACYLHACLRYVTSKQMTNASVRQRFGIADRNAATASHLLGEAVESGMILVRDPEAGTRNRTYLPFWACPPARGEEVV